MCVCVYLREGTRACFLGFPTNARLLLPINGLFVAQRGGGLRHAVLGEGYRLPIGYRGAGLGPTALEVSLNSERVLCRNVYKLYERKEQEVNTGSGQSLPASNSGVQSRVPYTGKDPDVQSPCPHIR